MIIYIFQKNDIQHCCEYYCKLRLFTKNVIVNFENCEIDMEKGSCKNCDMYIIDSEQRIYIFPDSFCKNLGFDEEKIFLCVPLKKFTEDDFIMFETSISNVTNKDVKKFIDNYSIKITVRAINLNYLTMMDGCGLLKYSS